MHGSRAAGGQQLDQRRHAPALPYTVPILIIMVAQAP